MAYFQGRDIFFWLGQINKATIVTNVRSGLLTAEQGSVFAKALQRVIDAAQENAPRPSTALTFEPLLIQEAGYEITSIHAGRSSQDIHATFRAAIIRDNLMVLAQAVCDVLESLLSLSEKHQDTIVPTYTNGVLAQASFYAHSLLAFVAAFERDFARIQECFNRFNVCAMGTTVLNGTSWPLDREGMAKYLGFAGIVDNAYDAGQLASVDQAVELGSIVQGIALHISLFTEDLLPQYAQVRPWILLDKSSTYASTAMPQKRNPGLINGTRAKASYALSQGFGASIVAHNITPGMPDPKGVEQNAGMVHSAMEALKGMHEILASLQIHKERALEEVNADWIMSQELADALLRVYHVPFRIGHHYASLLVDYGRAHVLRPLDFPYAEAKRLYAETYAAFTDMFVKDGLSSELPLSEEQFRQIFSPERMLQNRNTKGSANPIEIQRMIEEGQERLAKHKAWLQGSLQHIDTSFAQLEQDFLQMQMEDIA